MSNMILVLDLGDGRGANIARRVRSEQVFSQVLNADAPIEAIRAADPMGILIAGDGDRAVPSFPALIELGVPVLVMGAGARLLLEALGGSGAPTAMGEDTAQVTFEDSPLFEGLGASERYFERMDALELPDGVRAIATAEDGQVAAFSLDDRVFGMQFYAEQNDPDGFQILRNFARGVCKCEPIWNFPRFFEESIAKIQSEAPDGLVLLAVSGGVDSVVSAILMHKALGERLACVHVDTGLMRKGELDLTRKCLEPQGVRLRTIDARARFTASLAGVTGSGQKTAAVDREIQRVLGEEARALGAVGLGLGVNYSDVLEAGQSARPEPPPPFQVLIQPVRKLFKEEVRQVAEQLNLPPELSQRPAFPAAGLAVRVMGAATPEKLDMLREADAIFSEEIQKAGLDKKVRQYFSVLTGSVTRGTSGRMGCTLALRAMGGVGAFRLPYDLLERVVERVTGEVAMITRVVYDVTGHPPALVEWEDE